MRISRISFKKDLVGWLFNSIKVDLDFFENQQKKNDDASF